MKMMMRSVTRTCSALFVFAVVFILFRSDAHAAAQNAQSDARREFASFIDGFFAGIQRDWNVPGMVFIAVRDGEVIYKNGYGHTSYEVSQPVSPDATLFRVGEISKIFTASAVMQLAEKGRVALDDDVNTYLRKNKLAKQFDDPVTIRHLLTQTAGFDHKEFETCAPNADAERGFANRLTRVMPRRSFAPGIFYCPSNMGYALLGSIVERYSRQSFPSAIKRHIFTPLGMTSSTFSPTDDLLKSLAVGYDERGTVVPYAYHYDAAAVSMSTTASDMGRFMIAAMNGGRIGRGRILSDMFAHSMLRTHFTPHPLIGGTTPGCIERVVRGLRTLQASGNIPGYSSFMMLIPDKKFGIFYAANISGVSFSEELSSAVVSRFFAQSVSASSSFSRASGQIPDEVIGSYRSNMISRQTAEKIAKLFADQIKIERDGDVLLLTRTEKKDSPPERWARESLPDQSLGRDIYRMVDEFGRPTADRMFFQRDERGEVCAMILGNVSETYDKLDSFDVRDVQIVLFAVFMSVLLISALGTIMSISINSEKLPWEKGIRASAELWTISTLFCFIQGAFLLGLWLANKLIGDEFVVFVPYHVKALFVIPLAGTLLLAWFCFRLVTGIIDPEHHWLEKIVLIVIAAIEILFVVFLYHWRLLGFMF